MESSPARRPAMACDRRRGAARRCGPVEPGVLLPRRPPEQRSFWVTYPLSSLSRAALFAHAEQITDAALAALVAEHAE